MGAENIEELQSLIHAQAVPVAYIEEKFGVVLKGRKITELALTGYSEPSNGKNPALQTGEVIRPNRRGIRKFSSKDIPGPSAKEPDGKVGNRRGRKASCISAPFPI